MILFWKRFSALDFSCSDIETNMLPLSSTWETSIFKPLFVLSRKRQLVAYSLNWSHVTVSLDRKWERHIWYNQKRYFSLSDFTDTNEYNGLVFGKIFDIIHPKYCRVTISGSDTSREHAYLVEIDQLPYIGHEIIPKVSFDKNIFTYPFTWKN